MPQTAEEFLSDVTDKTPSAEAFLSDVGKPSAEQFLSDIPQQQTIPQKLKEFFITKPSEAAKTLRMITSETVQPESEIIQQTQQTGKVPYFKIAKKVGTELATEAIPITPIEQATVAFGGRALSYGGRLLAKYAPRIIAKLAPELISIGKPVSTAESLIARLGEGKTIQEAATELGIPESLAQKAADEIKIIQPVAKAAQITTPQLLKIKPVQEIPVPNINENPIEGLTKSVEATTQIVNEFKKKIPEITADTSKVVAYKQGKKISDIIAESIEQGLITPQEGARLFGVELGKDEGAKELANAIRTSRTAFGQGLNRLSQAAASFEKEVGKHPELSKALDSIRTDSGEVFYKKLFDSIGSGSRKTINFWRASLIGQMGTAVRNAVSQGARVGVGFFDDALNGSMRAITGKEVPRAAFSNAVEDILSLGRFINKAERQKISNILDMFPTNKALFESSPMSDLTLSGKYIKLITKASTIQEKFYRHVAFDARLRSNLTRLGLTIDDLPNMNKYQASTIVYDAVQHALDLTFARTPSNKTAKAILNLYNEAPILSVLGNPFPRFWFNNLKFNFEFSPLGIMFTRAGAKNPELFFRGARRAITGTALFSAAWVIRNSKFGGDKYYEIRPDPEKDPLRYIDVRAYNPILPTQLFVADLIKRTYEKSIGLRADLGYSPQELSNAIFALRRSDFSGIPILDNFVFNKDDLLKDPQKLLANLEKTAGDFIGGFAVPFKNFRDLQSGFEPQIVREAKVRPITGPFMESVPVLREALPPVPSTTRPGPRFREEPLKRQFGETVIRKTEVERELDRLGIPPIRTNIGEPNLDLKAAAILGPLVDKAIGDFIKSNEYKNSDKVAAFNHIPTMVLQKQIIEEKITKLKQAAVKEALASDKEQYLKKYIERKKPVSALILKQYLKSQEEAQ